MKHKIAIIRSAFALSIITLAPIDLAAQGLTLASNLPVENPPKTVSKKKPQVEDFNALFRDFLETSAVDVSKEAIDPKLMEFFSKDTSNALYGRLKVRERKYEGGILVSAVAIGKEQVVVISARIIYKHFLSKTMQAEYIQVVFSPTGKFKEVRKGLSTNQDL